MRDKLFYTPDQITNNLYTSGKEYMFEDATEYIGPYHLYTTTGEIYSESKWSRTKSLKLIPYIERTAPTNTLYRSLKQLNIKTKTIQPFTPIITNEIRKQQFLKRYFLKKVNEEIIYEVSEKTYQQWQKSNIDSKLYIGVLINWYISGNIDDEYVKGVLIRGVNNQNRRQIKAAQRTIPEINSKLTNLLEFYTDTSFLVPPDINDSAI